MSVNGVEIRLGQTWRLRDGEEFVVAHYLPGQRDCWQMHPSDTEASSQACIHVDDTGHQSAGEELQGDLVQLLREAVGVPLSPWAARWADFVDFMRPPGGAVSATVAMPPQASRKHSHYFKDVTHLTHIDVYRVLSLFNVTDQALGHAIKKLLVAGGRGMKGIDKDIQEAIDTLLRWQEMRAEIADTNLHRRIADTETSK